MFLIYLGFPVFPNGTAGLGCHGYEDLLLQLHEKLLPPDQHPLDASEPPQDTSPPEALEAAWAAGEKPQAESEADQRDAQEDQEESEKSTVEAQLSPAEEELSRLEAKVQEAMKRTARAQLQLRRKKAEELLLVGLVKHLKAACKVYREPGEEPEEENIGCGTVGWEQNWTDFWNALKSPLFLRPQNKACHEDRGYWLLQLWWLDLARLYGDKTTSFQE